ncbi:MAG: Nramp family divalent metal transporter [Capsulimonas sp.]|uniref:Nramp family divalent metal transporter n=1 Tax=Capsulimonas sp. TaxID=2494211 RepID=UPI0032670296
MQQDIALAPERPQTIWNRLRAFAPYLGPAFLVSVGYMDPGNWGTNIAGGATFGYALLWVLLLSNVMALILQMLAAKLGIVTGRTLAENCRDQFSTPAAISLWIVVEIAMLATDMAEFLGAALGFKILFHIPLFPAALITGVIVFLVLAIYRYGFRAFEGMVVAMVAVVGVCYAIEISTAGTLIHWAQVLHGVFVPTLPAKPSFALGSDASIVVAIGMLGATVMPHNLFLHSGVIKTRVGMENNVDTPGQADVHTRKIVRFSVLDSLLALNIAWLINSAMIILAAATFFRHHIEVTSLEQAHATLKPLLGAAAPTVFGIALLAAGISSSVTGTLAGQMVMEGFLRREFSVMLRRGLTMVPALIVIYLMPRTGWGDTQILVISQVCLSLALPFVVIPLLMFTRRKDLMREHANKPFTNFIATVCVTIIIALNVLLIWHTFGGALPFSQG